jgi:hypothetical protein
MPGHQFRTHFEGDADVLSAERPSPDLSVPADAPANVPVGALVIKAVLARSKFSVDGVEDAWVSLLGYRSDEKVVALVTEFKAADFGGRAWDRAVKFGDHLADRLGIAPVRQRRGVSG